MADRVAAVLGRRGTTVDLLLAAGFLVVGLLLAPLLAARPTLGLALGVGALLTVFTAVRPVAAVAGYVTLAPLIAGLARGQVVPSLRLNEVLLVPIMAGLALVVFGRLRRSRWSPSRDLHPLDLTVVAVAFTD